MRPIFGARLPLREYIATFSGSLWRAALENPASYVRWVVMPPDGTPDRVSSALRDNPNFTDRYTLQFEDNGYGVYRRNDD